MGLARRSTRSRRTYAGPRASPQSQIATDAAAREDDDFADLALQESTGEAQSVDARGLEVGARHRLGLVDADP
jgi:hypothetical protein